MIEFQCPNCSKRLKAPIRKSGLSLPCPACKTTITIPKKKESDDFNNSVDFATETAEKPTFPIAGVRKLRPCPYCAEDILVAAKKCRYCGEFVDGESLSYAQPTVADPAIARKQKDPGIAAVFSFIIPGLGQVYNGQILVGIVAGITCVLLYIIIIGFFVHIWLICDAYSYATQLNNATDGENIKRRTISGMSAEIENVVGGIGIIALLLLILYFFSDSANR